MKPVFRLCALLLGAAVWFGARSLSAAPLPSPPAPPPFQLDDKGAPADDTARMWGDGENLLFLRSQDRVFELRRGQPAIVHQLSSWSLREDFTQGGMNGHGTGARAVVVVWDSAGHVEWRTQAGWQRAELPVRATGYHHREAMVDDSGRVYISEGPALYMLDHGEWRTVALPLQKGVLSKLYVMPDGSLLITTFFGEVARVKDGQAEALAFPGIPEELRGYFWAESFYSPATASLWIMANKSVSSIDSYHAQALLALDVNTRQVRRYPLVVRGPRTLLLAEHLRGAATAQGDKLVFSDRSLMFFDGQEITQVRDWDADSFSVSLPRGGALAMALVMTEGDKAAYFMNGRTLTRSPLFETATAKRHRLDTDREARGPIKLPILHVAMGPVWHLTPLATGSDFALDLNAGVLVVFNKSHEHYLVGLRPLLTYSYDRTDAVGGHFLSAGLGVGVGRIAIAGVYTPRVVVEAAGLPRVGFRHGLSLELLGTAFTIELAHQVLFQDGLAQQDVRLLFGINPGPLIIGGIFAGFVRAFFGK